jgi:drug/metabolite transporter (DMT)-like permease
VIVIGPDLLRDLGTNTAAQLACLIGALSYALATVYARRFREQPPLVTASGQMAAATVLMLPFTLVIDQPWSLNAAGPAAIGAVLWLGVMATGFGNLLFYRVLAQAGATNSSLVSFLVPVSAIVIGAVAMGETLALRHFIGMGAIALGLAALDGRIFRLLRR